MAERPTGAKYALRDPGGRVHFAQDHRLGLVRTLCGLIMQQGAWEAAPTVPVDPEDPAFAQRIPEEADVCRVCENELRNFTS